jgi:TonB family protein
VSDPASSSAPADKPAAGGASESPAATPASNPTDIVPPVAIAQALPRATDITVPLGGPQTILLDIVIDETGRVERAEVRRSVNRLYEAQLVAATRGWRYTPATQAGKPVKMRTHPRSHAQPQGLGHLLLAAARLTRGREPPFGRAGCYSRRWARRGAHAGGRSTP